MERRFGTRARTTAAVFPVATIDRIIAGRISSVMRSLRVLPCVAALFFASAFIFSGCQNSQPSAPSSGSAGTHAGPRVPNGAASQHDAAVRFFNAYKTHNRPAAKEVAADAAINELGFSASAGTNATLQLMDDSHIYYEGGSIELKFARNEAGRWYVRSVSSTAD